MTKGLKEAPASSDGDAGEMGMPDMDDPKVAAVMNELERDMEHMDENNPRHMAHMMKRMKEIMPPGTVTKEMDEAIKRLEKGEDPEKIEEEMGDLLFSIANLSRKLGIEPEQALRKANEKFTKRFNTLEANTRSAGRTLEEMSLEDMEGEWQRIKTTNG